MTNNYDQSGNYIAIASVAVLILAKFGLQVTADDIVTVIAGVVALYGIIKQFSAHKKLAIQTGDYPSQS